MEEAMSMTTVQLWMLFSSLRAMKTDSLNARKVVALFPQIQMKTVAMVVCIICFNNSVNCFTKYVPLKMVYTHSCKEFKQQNYFLRDEEFL